MLLGQRTRRTPRTLTLGTALDLYAGVGLFSSVLNREFERVIAVESSPTSHADLLYNSPANVKAVRATTEQYLENVAGKLRPELVVVDPPRSGLGERVIKGLVKLRRLASLMFRAIRQLFRVTWRACSNPDTGWRRRTGGFISSDLPPGKRVPPRPLAADVETAARLSGGASSARSSKPVGLRSTEQPGAAVPSGCATYKSDSSQVGGSHCCGLRWPLPRELPLVFTPGGRHCGGWRHGLSLPCRAHTCSGDGPAGIHPGIGDAFFSGRAHGSSARPG